MKTIIIAIAVVGVMALAVQFNYPKDSYEYVREDTVEVIEAPKEPWMTDEDAIKAAQAVIRKKELEAELAGLKAEHASTSNRIKEVEKELGTY
jgi:hypothetical protein